MVHCTLTYSFDDGKMLARFVWVGICLVTEIHEDGLPVFPDGRRERREDSSVLALNTHAFTKKKLHAFEAVGNNSHFHSAFVDLLGWDVWEQFRQDLRVVHRLHTV